jgi:two-component system CheB/CheR fusion protein
VSADASFEALLDFLKRSRAFDFTGYKRTSLERRFRRRLEEVGCRSFGDYLDYLEVHPEEYQALFDTILINVTEFFRDPQAWEHLREQALPRMLRDKPVDEPIRVWSAGCAGGQEAYTVAIVLAEALGLDAFRERVKIYATDMDEDALATARSAQYTAKQVEGIDRELLERYFERSDQRWAFRKDLRRTVIFGRNNLVSDAPISRLDLLLCRNTLMYFTAETQERILRHFHFALRQHGILMLGRSEMMISHRDLFTPLDLKQRIFSRRSAVRSLGVRVTGMGAPEEFAAALSEEERASRDAALELGPSPNVIVSRAGLLTFANVPARALFGLSLEDLGKPFEELPLATTPVELKGPVAEALRDRRRVSIGEVPFTPEHGEPRRLHVAVFPLLADGAPALGVDVVFEDVTRFGRLRDELDEHRRELEQAYEELQSTIDELETTNEELQSANEELQTTNEELQSTNEELETMNEELQSTNEELETINDELRERTSELNQVNDFLEAILTSLGIAVAVLDREGRVQVWNHRADDLWGLRPDEAIEHHFLSLDIGLPMEGLAHALRAVLGGASDREVVALQAVNRRGRPITCTTTVLPLVAPPGSRAPATGAILLMEDGPPAGDGADGMDGARRTTAEEGEQA